MRVTIRGAQIKLKLVNQFMLNLGFVRLLNATTGVRFVAIAAVTMILATGGWWASAEIVRAQDSDLEFRKLPSANLAVLRDEITEGVPAHIQITIINSNLNDVSVVGEIVLSLPNTLLAHSTTDGATGGATTNHIAITNPISSGTAETYDIWVQASPESKRVYKIEAEVSMWPFDPESMVANKKHVHREHLGPETGSVVSAPDSGWSGCVAIECAPESLQVACNELLCKPWGWFLVGYAAIASLMISVVTVRSFVTRY